MLRYLKDSAAIVEQNLANVNKHHILVNMTKIWTWCPVFLSDRLRSRREPRTARRGLTQPSLTHRPGSAAAQRVSGRMTKTKAKLAVLHEVVPQALLLWVPPPVYPSCRTKSGAVDTCI